MRQLRGGTDWPTWLALVFGGVAALVAADSLRIQAREHKRFTQELAKRADFEIGIRLLGLPTEGGPDSATCAIPADIVNLRFAIGIRNTGARAATHVTINFLAPDRHGTLAWCSPDGDSLPDMPKAADTRERLSEEPGAPLTRWLPWDMDRIAMRTPRMVWACVRTDVPLTGSVDFPVRARVQSDDLPDDVDQRVTDYVLHIRREGWPLWNE